MMSVCALMSSKIQSMRSNLNLEAKEAKPAEEEPNRKQD